jgi:VCBS repeat-containing protein
VAGPSHGTLVLNGDGSFTYTPEANYFGDDSFTYRASDGGEASNVATVTITVTPVNDAPVAVADSAIGTEDSPINGSVLDNDSDPEGDSLSAALVTGPAHGSVALNPDGSFIYTPTGNYFGPDSFTYQAHDGTVGSNVATVSLAITPVNDAPVAVADRFFGDEDSIFSGNVLDNDYDVDGDALSVTLLSTVTHGCMMLDADGVFHYRPTSDWFGSDSFTYRISDGLLSADTTVTLVVNPVNDAPISADDSYTLLAGTPLVVTSNHGVLVNDSDIEHGLLTALLVDGPAHGSLTFNVDGGFSYSANTGYTGADSFTYRASDGTAESSLATVSLTVAPATLQVTSFEQTGSGFNLRFNRAVDASVLNLYSAADNPMGSADLTLSGPAGTVKGSLILDADLRGAHFIQTGGPLAAGDYRLTLASRSNGFKDLAGNLLDGDLNGTVGDDYVTRFTVSSLGSQALLTIGDLSAGPGQSISAITGGLPISLANAAGASRIRFQLAYNPDLLCISGVSYGSGISGSANWTSQPGLIVFDLASTSPLSNASTELVRLLGSVPSGNIEHYGAKQLLDLRQVSLNNASGGALNVRIDDGIHVNVYLGDNSGNAGYASLDVQRSQRVNVSLDTGFGAFPLADPRLIGDIDHDGGINVSDAMLLTRELKYLSNPALYASFNRPEIADIPAGVDLLNFRGDDPLVNIPTNLNATAGGLVTVPVMLAAIDPGLDHISLDAIALKLSWDPGQLELVSVGPGNLTGDFLLRETGRGAGRLAIEMSRLYALDCAYGSLLQLQFRVAAGASGTLRVDLVEATLNETRLTLNPAPQLGADPTDGTIRVNAPDQTVTPFAAFAPDTAVTSNVALSPLIDFNSRFNGFAFKAGDNKGWLGDWLTDSKVKKPNLEALRIQPKLTAKLSARL